MELNTATKKVLASFGFIMILGFIVQFVNPMIENTPVRAKFETPRQVKKIVEGSCYACHSNQTQLGSWNIVTPISWLVTSDMQKARRAMNQLTPSEQKLKQPTY